jgi:hypothetical protein
MKDISVRLSIADLRSVYDRCMAKTAVHGASLSMSGCDDISGVGSLEMVEITPIAIVSYGASA